MRDSPAANPAPSAARPRVRAGAIQRASAMPGFARRAIPAPDQRRESSWFRARPARQFASLIKRNRAGGEMVHRTPDNFGIVVSISQSRFEESKQGRIRLDKKKLGYFGWKFTRIKLPPIRNSVPSRNMAARTRSSS